ncbi:MAG: DUF4097 family beta strand repeat-containing protein [Spirochaetales bacterium]
MFQRIVIFLLVASAPLAAMGQREGGSFSYDGVDRLTVEAASFEVTVEPARERGIGMQIKNKPDEYTVYHERNGNEIRVWVEKSFSLFSRPHNGQLEFGVPDDIEIEIRSSVGNVEVEGIAGVDVVVRTSTGSVEMESIRGSLGVTTSTGDIDLKDIDGEVETQTTTGRIEMHWIRGPVNARSSTGRQVFEDVQGDIDATSTTGRIELVRTRGAVALKTSTGGQRGSDVLLSGPSRFESTTGNIEIDIEQEVDELEFDLRSTTGSLEVDGDRSQRKLFLGGSGFRVVGSTSTGSQRYH